MKRFLLLSLFYFYACNLQQINQEDDNYIRLFNGRDLKGWELKEFGHRQEINFKNGILTLGFGYPLTGIAWKDESLLPKVDYEISFDAKREYGDDFFVCLTFPYKKSYASLILGGWAGAITGISSIDGKDASNNETTRNIDYKNKKWYAIRLRATEQKIQVWLGTTKIIDISTMGKKLSTRSEVSLTQPLGFATFETVGKIKNFKLKRLH